MIRNSFIFIPGIGLRKERSLWSNGILDWDDYISAKKVSGISISMKAYGDRLIHRAKEALYSGNIEYLSRILPKSEHWRFYRFFQDDALALDIETAGLYGSSQITVVGLHDRLEFKAMVDGMNLDYHRLAEEISKSKLLLTFNGSSFDIPMLQKNMHLPTMLHIDLMPLCRRIGLRGGLKEIERTLGIMRPLDVNSFHGGDAFSLWRIYRATRDEYYLKLLLEYNELDCENLFKLADYAIKELTAKSLPVMV